MTSDSCCCLKVATADHFESRSEDEDEYDLGEMETEAEEERDIFEMPPMSSIVGRAQRPGLLSQIMHALHFQYMFEPSIRTILELHRQCPTNETCRPYSFRVRERGHARRGDNRGCSADGENGQQRSGN